MTLRNPHLLILRPLFLALAFGAVAWWWMAVVLVLSVGCDQLYGAAALAAGVFLYICAVEVLGRGDRCG